MVYLIPLLLLPLFYILFYHMAVTGELSVRRALARREGEILSLLEDQLLFLDRKKVGLIGMIVPLFAVRVWIRLRKKKIERQVPDFLKFISGAVKAGASISEAIRQGARDLPPPLSDELDLIRKHIRMGKSFDEAILHFRDRVDLEEVRLLVSALVLANSAGGSLTGTLGNLEKTLEERERIRSKVSSLTAQGKMQGWVVGSIPMLLGGILFLIDPGLMAPFWTTVPGIIALLSVIFLEAAGFYSIRKIVREEF